MHDYQKKMLDYLTQDENDLEHTAWHGGRSHGKSELYKAYQELYEKLIQQDRMKNEERQQLLAEGWLPVPCSMYFLKNWTDCHTRCKEMFDEENYKWTGEIFWFRTEQDVVMFKLAF